MKAGFNNKLGSDHNSHISSKITITPETWKKRKKFTDNIMKEMANTYARIINDYQFINIYTRILLARFYEQDEDDQVLDENEI